MNEAHRGFAVDVVKRLRDEGHTAYFAGGCVRDMLLGQPSYDFDVATDATPDRVMAMFRRTIAVGVSFGVVRVLGARDQGEVEVATFRSDGAYLDGRHPESVHFGSPQEDAARRDFTINGMFLDPITDEVIDFVGGRDDLERGVIRAIGDPLARFEEDKLRLLRAVRFASRFQFEIDPATRSAVEAMAPRVGQVAFERISHELKRMLVHPTRSRAIELAHGVGLLSEVLPELLRYEFDDRWTRTRRILDHLPDDPSFPLAMAALLLELGETSHLSAETIAARLKFSNAERDRVTWLLKTLPDLHHPAELGIARRKKMLSQSGIGELLDLFSAWTMASSSDLVAVDYWRAYRDDPPEGPINPPVLLTGHDLMKHGWTPGPRFAEILEAVRDAQLEGVMQTPSEAIAWAASRWPVLRPSDRGQPGT